MFVKSGFELVPEFVSSSRDTFNSEPQSVDFTNPDTRDVINTWVEQQTSNKITELIQKSKNLICHASF
jgi:serpin B